MQAVDNFCTPLSSFLGSGHGGSQLAYSNAEVRVDREDARWHELLDALGRRKIICSVWAVPARKGCEGAEVVSAVDEDGTVAVAEDLNLVSGGQPAAD
jgi:hypothetical protein